MINEKTTWSLRLRCGINKIFDSNLYLSFLLFIGYWITVWFIISRRYVINIIPVDCVMFVLFLCFMGVNFVKVFVFIDLVFCMMYFIETEVYISILHYFTCISTSQWISDLKGSVYPLFYILALFKLLFLAYVDTICISSYIFSEKLKFEVFKTEKTAFKYLNEEKYRWSEKEEFEILEIWVTLLSNKNLSENFYKRILDEK